MAEVAFRPVRQLSEYKGKGASASRERVLSTELKRQNSTMNSTQFNLVTVIKNIQFNGEVKSWRALVLLSFFSLSVSGPMCDRFPQKLEFKHHVNLRTTFSG